MIALRHLRACIRGTTATEFALIAPVFFTILFGVVEGSRMVWTQQTLDEVAYATARCMAVDTACDSTTEQQAFAVARATGYGVAITSGQVTPSNTATCGGIANSNGVTIDFAFSSPVSGLIPGMPRTVQAKSCYPTLS